jgi:hypothetical protein
MESEPVQTQDVVEVVEPVAQEPVQNQDAQEPVQNQDSQEPVQNQDVVEEPVQNQNQVIVEEPVQNQDAQEPVSQEPVQNQNQDVVEVVEPVQNQNQDVVEVVEPVQNQVIVEEEPVQNQNQDVVEVVEPVSQEPVSQEPVQNQDVVEEEPVQNQDVVEEPVSQEPVSQEPVQTQDVVEEPAPEIIIPTTHKEIDSLNLFFIMKHCMSEMLLIRAMHSMLDVVPDAWTWVSNVDITNVNEGVDPMFDAIQHHMNEQTDFKRDVTWELRKNAFVWIIRQLNYIAKHGVPQYKTLYANYNPTMDIEGLWVQSEAGI